MFTDEYNIMCVCFIWFFPRQINTKFEAFIGKLHDMQPWLKGKNSNVILSVGSLTTQNVSLISYTLVFLVYLLWFSYTAAIHV